MDDDLDLMTFLKFIWQKKLRLVGAVGFCVCVAVAYIIFAKPMYTASALLAPASGASGGISSLISQYGGLASLAGISLPNDQESDSVALALETLESRDFVKQFTRERKVLPLLMGVKRFNAEVDELIYDERKYDTAKRVWVRKKKFPYEATPAVEEFHKEFKKRLRVSEDKKTGFVKLEFKHESPNVAEDIVTWLIEDLNETLRKQDIIEKKKSISFLQDQIERTPYAELRSGFFEMIEAQTEVLLLTEVRDEYVFKTIDSPMAKLKPTDPNKAIVLILGAFVGAILSLVYVFFTLLMEKRLNE